jgi:geranylgeranyl diphosphate synthase type I
VFVVKAPPSRDLARRVTDELLAYISSERGELEREARPLLDELESIVVSGGKRLRPRFCYWGHIAAGGTDDPQIVSVGAALELLHTMAIIQDDVMDRSDTRRNRASTFRTLAELSAGVEHRGNPERFGASAAILTGMLGFVLADRLFAKAGEHFGTDAARRAADRYDRMRVRAIAGQYLDLLAVHRGHADEETARRIASLKSGSYSVADPLAIGALLATHDERVVGALDRYGVPLGEAFQIRDDVLGIFGDPSTTGKDADGDIREGKQTVLWTKALKRANAEQRRLLETLAGDPGLTSQGADHVRRLIVETGALEETEALVAELAGRAKSALHSARTAFDPAAVDELTSLADEATVRRA